MKENLLGLNMFDFFLPNARCETYGILYLLVTALSVKLVVSVVCRCHGNIIHSLKLSLHSQFTNELNSLLYY